MAEDPGYKNCWEHWHCKKEFHERCPVFKAKDGRKCWMYTDNLKVFEWIKSDRKLDKCSDCPWYKHVNKQ